MDADLITIEATNDVITEKLNLNDKKAVITAGRDVDADLTGVGNRQNGLVAKAGRNMKVTTDGTLSVSSLISGNDMTLGAKEIISGFGKTDKVLREEGDSADRAYIEVGGEFKSNPAYETTDSADLTADAHLRQISADSHALSPSLPWRSSDGQDSCGAHHRYGPYRDCLGISSY